jgi:hypothetical protein
MSRSPLRAALLATCLFLLGPHSALAIAAAAAPKIPEQVSSADWEQDMQRFAQADAAHPPKRGGVLFVGRSWRTRATKARKSSRNCCGLRPLLRSLSPA